MEGALRPHQLAWRHTDHHPLLPEVARQRAERQTRRRRRTYSSVDSPGASTITSDEVVPSTSALNADASAAIGGNVS